MFAGLPLPSLEDGGAEVMDMEDALVGGGQAGALRTAHVEAFGSTAAVSWVCSCLVQLSCRTLPGSVEKFIYRHQPKTAACQQTICGVSSKAN